MTNKEKIMAIQSVIAHPSTEDVYYRLLESIDGLKLNYSDYLITEPINYDMELERLQGADFDLATALLTMLLKEEQFSNGSLKIRHQNGEVNAVLHRIIQTLT